MGGVLAVLFSPWLERMEQFKRFRIANAVGAALITLLATTMLLILPGSILASFLVKAGFHQIQVWKLSPTAGSGLFDTVMEFPVMRRFLLWVTDLLPMNLSELADTLREWAIRWVRSWPSCWAMF